MCINFSNLIFARHGEAWGRGYKIACSLQTEQLLYKTTKLHYFPPVAHALGVISQKLLARYSLWHLTDIPTNYCQLQALLCVHHTQWSVTQTVYTRVSLIPRLHPAFQQCWPLESGVITSREVFKTNPNSWTTPDQGERPSPTGRQGWSLNIYTRSDVASNHQERLHGERGCAHPPQRSWIEDESRDEWKISRMSSKEPRGQGSDDNHTY